jgi:hypothetical protein
MGGVVAVVGSRSLPSGGVALVSHVSCALSRTGHTLAVGCAHGADAAVLNCVIQNKISASSVQCFSAFGQDRSGSCGVSAVAMVSAFSGLGGSVSWWAGGGSSVPVRGRLAVRARAVVSSASVSVVAFFSSASSIGTFKACQFGASRGLSVVAFPLGFSGSSLPSLGSGSWVVVGGSGIWSNSFRWVADDLLL